MVNFDALHFLLCYILNIYGNSFGFLGILTQTKWYTNLFLHNFFICLPIVLTFSESVELLIFLAVSMLILIAYFPGCESNCAQRYYRHRDVRDP